MLVGSERGDSCWAGYLSGGRAHEIWLFYALMRSMFWLKGQRLSISKCGTAPPSRDDTLIRYAQKAHLPAVREGYSTIFTTCPSLDYLMPEDLIEEYGIYLYIPA